MVALIVSSFFPRHLKYRNQKEISDAHTNASFILKWLCISGTWGLRSCIVRSIAYWIDFLYYFMSCQAAIHARIVLLYLDLHGSHGLLLDSASVRLAQSATFRSHVLNVTTGAAAPFHAN